MKKLALALAATAAFAGQAFAADMAARMPVKAAPVVAPVASWTGCYIGAGGGYGLYDIESQMFNGNNVPATIVNRQFDQGGRGWIGTGQVGCDYQFPIGASQFVVGAFGDYNFSDIKGGFTGNGVNVGLDSNTEKVDWYWSVGGRVGWLVNPQLLTYFSGGYTEAHRTGFSNYLSGAGVVRANGLQGGTTQGWFLGSGVEHTLWLPNLTWKTEYRFSRYDTRDSQEIVAATGLNTGFFSRDKLYTHAVVSTISYRFNLGGPVVAKY